MTIIILFALCRILSGVNPGEVVPYHGHLKCFNALYVIIFIV